MVFSHASAQRFYLRSWKSEATRVDRIVLQDSCRRLPYLREELRPKNRQEGLTPSNALLMGRSELSRVGSFRNPERAEVSGAEKGTRVPQLDNGSEARNGLIEQHLTQAV